MSIARYRTVVFSAALLATTHVSAAPNPPSGAQAVPRYDAPITMAISWTDNSNDEDNFEIQRREVGGTFAFLTSVGPNTTTFVDTTATDDRDWEYRVRARSASDGNSGWTATTPRMRPRQIWPLPDGDHDILHTFGTPLNFSGFRYFHEGVDISASNVRVDAARGGPVTFVDPNSDPNGAINVRVDMGAAGMVTENYLHMRTDPALSVGDVLSPGDQVGVISNIWFNRAIEADHVHWGNATTNKLIPFTNPADRDPNLQPPQIADINNDGKDFILVRANDNNHNNEIASAFRDVDFLVDAFDDMAATNDLMVAPFSLGYWISSTVPGADTVQSAATPYRLFAFNYPLIGANGGNTPRENATAYWPLDADIDGLDTWQSTLTFILSNASNTAGDTNSPQAGEFWRTDARAGSGSEENGSDAARARENQEARFPDGEYFVNIVADDLVHTTNAARRVIVDNSRPYVKSVRVLSGAALAYVSEWNWDGTVAELRPSAATFDAASGFPVGRTRNVHIEVEFSEPMETAQITSVSPLGTVPNLASDQPEGRRTHWTGTISHLDISDDGSDDGQQSITISGTDLAGNALLQITSRADIGANNHNRDSSGALRGAAGNDTIHGFEIGAIEGQQNVTAIFLRSAGSDPASPTIAEKAAEVTTWLNDYFSEASYDNVSFNVSGVGWYALDDPLNSYYTNPQTPLVDLVQEAITDAEGDGVDLQGTNYVLVITDELSARDEWSTTGGWPYQTSNGTQVMASGVMNLASPRERASNLAGRMIGLVDLFAYPGVTVPRPFVGEWSHWSDKDSDVHPLGWEKWRAGWIDELNSSDQRVTRVSKPPVSAPIVNRSFTIGATDRDANERKAVAVEMSDDLHLMIEYRRLEGLDADLPEAGVVISRANDRVAQGEGPVILVESNATAGDLSDAPFLSSGPRSTFSDPGSGITVTVTAMNPSTATVRLDYAVPPFENDVYVADHDDRWKTIDIWVDAPDLTGGFSADPRSVISDAEAPVIGALNKLIGRVRNQGAADASNFEVELEVLEPWGTDGNWTQLDVRTVPLLQGSVNNANDDFLIIADWTPVQSGHTCVRLRTRTVTNDINMANNFTQENIHEFTSTSGSPFAPVVSRFQVKNPFSERLPILFRTDGLPDGWTAVINPARPVLNPDEVITAQVIVQPLDGAPHCTREEVTITAYAPQVDTLKSVGAITMGVNLKAPGAIVKHETWSDCDCQCEDPNRQRERPQCRVYTRACTDPGLPNTQVDVMYTAPDGTQEVRTVTTDAEGCFVDLLPRDVEPGVWQTTVDLPADQCRDGDRSGPIRVNVDDPRPDPIDRDCVDLKEALLKLTFEMREAIAQEDQDRVKLLFAEINDILRRGEDCPELRRRLAQLYEELIGAFFAGDKEGTEKLMQQILELLNS